jgi:hypothetical protein
MGLSIENGDDYIELFDTDAGFDERTGEVYEIQHMRAKLPNGKVFSPDKGWAHNPGAAAYGTDVAIAQKLGNAQSVELRSQLIQTLNNSPLRQKQVANWVDKVFDNKGWSKKDNKLRPRAGHGVQALGFMPEPVVQAVINAGFKPPSRLLAISEKELVHAYSEKHIEEGIALTREEFKDLVQMVNNPEAVLLERSGDALLLVYPAADGRKIKLVVKTGENLKRQAQPLDVIANAFKVELSDLQNEGMYNVIKGSLAP